MGFNMLPYQLKEKIDASTDQKMNYAAYMQEVLYNPVNGYYMREKEKVGTKGDFLTSSNIHDIYGKVFAKLFVNYIYQTGIPPFFLEIGGGNGRFARHFLEEIRELDKQLYQSLTYYMIEASPYHLKLQEKEIPADAPIRYYRSLDEMPQHTFEGMIFSNELFDALPVHVIEKNGSDIVEVFVTLDSNEGLKEKKSPLQNKDIREYLTSNKLDLSEGQRVEVPLAMLEYASTVAEKLNRGSIITVDYGYRLAELSREELKTGSLRGYYQHSMIPNPLLHPYEMDLTTHVHLDSLEDAYSQKALTHICTKRQGEFLVKAGIMEYLQEHYNPNPFSEKSKRNRAIRSLIMDGSWSNSFYVLIHEKGADGWSKQIKSD
ncbi:class I SAM-dependent methyltransferase [Sutcliffiella rhizosphaerae]|uniref:SAM-dependent methyltransferase n=1 Tax=Sutcliffiella rhizosphaerae TaxID=2880967 RepID=A0ABM8YHV0_9BACI|nr:SAM-dependent methyltransferase [Sutcliffiella rhizosphaerae]CAG9619290.1 hypothetical protein BACCIP111883_00057 [Sutcliffiella rhizosphaerae]